MGDGQLRGVIVWCIFTVLVWDGGCGLGWNVYILPMDNRIANMGHPSTLTIAQASLLFYSHHYRHLKCRIMDSESHLPLCSKLINNCIETILPINRDLGDFTIELYQDAVLVGVFTFTYDDLDNAMARDEGKQEGRRRRKRKYIKFRKENDCCALYFTIEAKDMMLGEDVYGDEDYIYEDYVRNMANKLYKKLEIKAMRRIDKIEKLKLQDKRMSINLSKDQDPSYIKNPTVIQKFASHDTANRKIQHNDPYPKFSQSWMGGNQLNGLHSFEDKCYRQKKDEYRLKRLRERAKKLFRKEIKEIQERDLVIIPNVKMSKNKMRLLSEGIVFPCRIKGQNYSQKDFGVKKNGFLENFKLTEPSQSYKSSNMSSQIFSGINSSIVSRKISNFHISTPSTLFSIKEKGQEKVLSKNKEEQLQKNNKKRHCILKKQFGCGIGVPTNFNQTFLIKSKAAIKFR